MCPTDAARAPLAGEGLCVVQDVRFPDAHCTSVLRNVKMTLAASRALAGSDPVLCVRMVTAVKTAR